MGHSKPLPLPEAATLSRLPQLHGFNRNHISSKRSVSPPNQLNSAASGKYTPQQKPTRLELVSLISGADASSADSNGCCGRHPCQVACCLPRQLLLRTQPKALVGPILGGALKAPLSSHLGLLLLLVSLASGQQLLYNESDSVGAKVNSNNNPYFAATSTSSPSCHHSKHLDRKLPHPSHQITSLSSSQHQNHLQSAVVRAATSAVRTSATKTGTTGTKTSPPLPATSGASTKQIGRVTTITKGNNASNGNSGEEPPVCNGCLAIPVVSILGAKQINGFILGSQLQKKYQLAKSSGYLNKYNDYQEYKITSNGYDPHNQQHSSPLEPKSDEKCPMTKFMTVCDQIGSYPADVIISKLVGAKKVLKHSYFNLDSLFSDEREHSSEPFDAEPEKRSPWREAEDEGKDKDKEEEREHSQWRSNSTLPAYSEDEYNLSDVKYSGRAQGTLNGEGNEREKRKKQTATKGAREQEQASLKNHSQIHRPDHSAGSLGAALLANHISDAANIDSKATEGCPTAKTSSPSAANYGDGKSAQKRLPVVASLASQQQQPQQSPSYHRISPTDEFVNLVEQQAFSLGSGSGSGFHGNSNSGDHNLALHARPPAGRGGATLAERLLTSRARYNGRRAEVAEETVRERRWQQRGRRPRVGRREEPHLVPSGGQPSLSRSKRQISRTRQLGAAQDQDQDQEEERRASSSSSLGGADEASMSASRADNNGPNADGQNQAEPICRAKSIYISPKAALNDKKQWKYVVNAPERNPQIRQIIRVDICEDPFGPCSDQLSLPFGFTSQCQQKYSKKKLLALDSLSGRLEVDTFFIPTCCVCQLVRDSGSVGGDSAPVSGRSGSGAQSDAASSADELASAAGSDSYIGEGGQSESGSEEEESSDSGGRAAVDEVAASGSWPTNQDPDRQRQETGASAAAAVAYDDSDYVDVADTSLQTGAGTIDHTSGAAGSSR